MSAHYVPNATEIELADGQYLDLADPMLGTNHTEGIFRPINVYQVARGLADISRYNGQAKRRYSVAEHAILVYRRLLYQHAPLEVQLGGLHHDDGEAFVGDVVRAVKSLVPEFRVLEKRVASATYHHIGIAQEWVNHHMVHAADEWALSAEAFFLMKSQGKGWSCDGLYNPQDEKHRQLATGILGSSSRPIDSMAMLFQQVHNQLWMELGDVEREWDAAIDRNRMVH